MVNYFLGKIELQAINFTIWVRSYSTPAFILHFQMLLETSTVEYYQPTIYMYYFFNLYIVSIFFFLIPSYLLAYSFRNSTKINYLNEGGMFLYAYIDEVEEECGQIEDAFFYLLYFFAFVLWFYVFNLFYTYIILKNLNWLISIFCFILILGFLVPSKVLTQMGLAFAQYVRGAGKSTSFLFEAILDFVSVSVIIMRFFIQNIRFVFIFIGFFEYYEYVYNSQQAIIDIMQYKLTWEGYCSGLYKNWSSLALVSQLLYQTLLYLFYVGHLTLTYISQLTVFIILSFWVFFFLYTTFTLPSADKFFFFKRCALLIK